MNRWFGALLLAASVLTGEGAAAAPLSDSAVAQYSREAIFGTSARSAEAARAFAARGESDTVAVLTLASRFRRSSPPILQALSELTGEPIESWADAMLWQEAHPEVRPHPSFREIKVEVLRQIDPEFARFLGGEKSRPENMKIRLEEITWGGVAVDGIPSLDNPLLIPAEEAEYLLDDDLVFGIEIAGDARAYPLRIMGWHEMFNDVVGGVPLALAYCTLCGAGILYETQVSEGEDPLVFGSSGLLYRSNKLMFDRGTDSLWNQFTGRPVSGPLVESGIELKTRPVVITSWAKWRMQHPETKVLSLETGHNRDYGSGVVYKEYFASPELMFPTIVRNEERVSRKDYIFGVRTPGAARAWPMDAFTGGAVINDEVGGIAVVLVGDAATRTVRAFERGPHRFAMGEESNGLTGPGGLWRVGEDALTGPNGERLARIPGHISYWFAWDGYLGVASSLYPDPT